MTELTTITPFWGRPEMLRGWLKAIKGASIPEVRHFIYFVGELPPEWWLSEVGNAPIITMMRTEEPGLSIGHYHNLGAMNASSEWIMKMDVDTIPSVSFFKSLLPVLRAARPLEWFNVGMFYVNGVPSNLFLQDRHLPLSRDAFAALVERARLSGLGSYRYPQATNFVCRKEDYLSFGGCSSEFKGWGWEDYQQIFELEWMQFSKDPLPGSIGIQNVTQRCRDEISRPKARELWKRNKDLCLLHRFHLNGNNPEYKAQSKQNKEVLLRHILRNKTE